jgi:hypothetical protein
MTRLDQKVMWNPNNDNSIQYEHTKTFLPKCQIKASYSDKSWTNEL